VLSDAWFVAAAFTGSGTIDYRIESRKPPVVLKASTAIKKFEVPALEFERARLGNALAFRGFSAGHVPH